MAIRTRSSLLLGIAGAAALAAGLMAPAPAHAWWRGGFAVGVVPFPFFVPPVVVAPPPVYYSPAPVYPAAPPPGYPYSQAPYAPGPYAQGSVPASPGQACYAGAYVCPMGRPLSVGSTCSCPTESGQRAYGNVR